MYINLESMLASLKAMQPATAHDERIRVTAMQLIYYAVADNGEYPTYLETYTDLNQFLLCDADSWMSYSLNKKGICNITTKQLIKHLRLTDAEQAEIERTAEYKDTAYHVYYFKLIRQALKLIRSDRHNHYYC